MMNAPVGFICVVTGRRRAIVSAGPMPGRTPIAVPRTEPTNAQKRFSGESATTKPWASWWRASTLATLPWRRGS